MKYMIMMFGEATAWEDKSPEWLGERHEFLWKQDQLLRDSGEYVDGAPLIDPTMATTVIFEEGSAVATDGPFAESKESIVGYWIVDTDGEARAIEIASEVVAFIERPMEIRRVMDEQPEV